jgi:citrate lyase subunit beta/citryl-CoA lyase
MKQLRSLLFVPGDRPERMAKALGTGADALILDLEDSVAVSAKPAARRATADFLRAERTNAAVQLFVRINPLDGDCIDGDLAALAGTRPDGIVLPKAEGGISVASLEAKLDAAGLHDALILPIATETPAAIFQLGTYAGSKRICGLTWGAEDLPAAIGASTSRDEHGRYTAPYQLARSLLLFGAHAAGVAAIETVYPVLRDLEGLTNYAKAGRRDGFTGMMAIHPSQVAPINDAFTPSDADVAAAQAIVDAFAAHPGAGVLNLDGRMIDAPHLKAAQRMLALKPLART